MEATVTATAWDASCRWRSALTTARIKFNLTGADEFATVETNKVAYADASVALEAPLNVPPADVAVLVASVVIATAAAAVGASHPPPTTRPSPTRSLV